MKHLLTLLIIVVFGSSRVTYSQTKPDTLAWIKHTSIKNQQNSGTCWSFATTSFIESEILRLNPKIKNIDLNEMYFAYYNYLNKLQRYYLLTGYMYWTMGGQSHDVMNVIREHGFVPEDVYPAYTAPNKGHDHTLLDTALYKIVHNIDYSVNFSIYKKIFIDTLNHYLGAVPDSFLYENKYINGKQFSENLKFNPDKYITLTSLANHQYYKWITLEDKFNWAGELYYNVPWQIFETICDSALMEGYSLAWDGDVTEKGFDPYKGIATVYYQAGNIENERLTKFFSHDTKIDHVMHIIGMIRKNGEVYYAVKNSWGYIGVYKGYLLMSKDYFRQKTIAVMLNVDALPKNLKIKFCDN